MTRRQRLQGTLWFIAVVIFLLVMFTLTFYLTDWLFTILAVTLSPLVLQLINSMGGLFLLGTTITILSRYVFKSRIEAGQANAFRPIIEALGRMAKGDFSVQVTDVVDSRGVRED